MLITGCSHSKVEEIVRATKQYLGGNIDLVEGGFHLMPYDASYISNIARLMKDDLGVRRVAPAHCTGNLAFKIFRELYGENYNYAGVESWEKRRFHTDVCPPIGAQNPSSTGIRAGGRGRPPHTVIWNAGRMDASFRRAEGQN